MKTNAAVILASLLSVASAAPAACNGAAPVTSSCTTIVTTITTTLAACAAVVTVTVPAANPAVTTPAATTPAPAVGDAAAGVNVQSFTGALGGISAKPVISASGSRPFSVNGDTFVGSGAALGRSCDIQHNACADAANDGSLSGGVGQCDEQNTQCHAANQVSAKLRALKMRSPRFAAAAVEPRALNLGTCSNPTILFEAGLDGRNTDAFIAANQDDFNHGSALNIAVIAGFICQRLGSPCDADAAARSLCSSASAAAVATSQNQAAADVFNSILNGGGAQAAAATTAAAPAVTTAPDLATAATSAILAGQTQVIVSTIVSCS